MTIKKCVRCKREQLIYAKGLCGSCYQSLKLCKRRKEQTPIKSNQEIISSKQRKIENEK